MSVQPHVDGQGAGQFMRCEVVTGIRQVAMGRRAGYSNGAGWAIPRSFSSRA
jgi:hypothetical protein